MSIDFDESRIDSYLLNDTTVFETVYRNSESLPYIVNYLQSSQQTIQTEYFEKTSGFNLIKGMSYRINAQQPRVDVNGKLFFTVKSVREWSYGANNLKDSELLYE